MPLTTPAVTSDWFDAGASWRVEPPALRSQGRHTPFEGHELPARVRATLVGGQVAFEASRGAVTV